MGSELRSGCLPSKGVPMREVGTSSWRLCGWFVSLMGFLCAGCVLAPAPRQMYEGAPLPKEQVGIVRSGCAPEGRLNIMILRIDGQEISDVCADFAVLPGEHQIELSAERVALSLAAPTMGSGGILGAPPSPAGASPQQGSRVIWRAQSPLRITCSVQAGKEVTIVGTGGTGPDWEARCQ